MRQRLKPNSRLLPKQAVEIMTQWYDRNYSNPYPTFRDCEILASNGNITIEQVKQWFVNVRRRTQNQFRKQRTAYSLKRKSEEINLDEDLLSDHSPKAVKPKLEYSPDTSAVSCVSTSSPPLAPTYTSPQSAANQSYAFSQHYSPVYPQTPMQYSYYANHFYNQTSAYQYFDNSGHFKPSVNSSYDLSASSFSNLSFDFSAPSSPNTVGYANPSPSIYYNATPVSQYYN